MIEKFSIKGEVFPFERRYSMTEGIALEQQEALGMTFGEWDAALKRGSAKALAGFIWLILRRNGRDVPLADIMSGEYPMDIEDLILESAGEDEDPTADPSSPSTGDATSGSSPRPSDTGRKTSASSKSRNSTT